MLLNPLVRTEPSLNGADPTTSSRSLSHRPWKAARAEFRVAWDGLMPLLQDEEAKRAALVLEEKVNALAASGAAVGWRLGVLARRGKED